jgi:hypothetical protein
MNNHRLIFTLFLSLMTVYTLSAQTVVSGKVTSEKEESLPGANIFIQDSYDGASSNTEGAFQFNTSENGLQTISISMIGYHAYTAIIDCDKEVIQLHIKLREKINQLSAVTITAGAMEASDVKKAVVMKPMDIVTTSGALGDIIGALNKLPGTSTVGNDGRLFVRGGDASETNIYFDGLQVGNAYGSTAQNVPTRSRFNPSLFKGSFFSTGGYSAEYGQALSSALVLNSIDMPLRNQTDISLMSIGGAVLQTLVGDKNAVTASASFMDLSPYMSIIDQKMEFTDAPRNWNAEVLGRQKIGKSGLLKAFVHTEHASMAVNQNQVGTSEKLSTVIDNTYHFGNISFRNVLNNGWSYYGGASLSYNIDEIKLADTQFERKGKLGHVKGVIIKDFSDKLSIKNGVEFYYNSYSEENKTAEQLRSFDENTINHFIESDYYFNKKLVIRGGLRTTYNQLINSYWTSPRASLAYKVAENSQLSLAYGQFKQLPKNEIRIQNTALKNTTATHYILNYMYADKGRVFRSEVFYKGYDELIRYEATDGFNYENLSTSGTGFAQGFDVFYRDNHTFENTDFWLTYSFTDSKRHFKNFENQVIPGYAPRHNASAVMKHFVKTLHSQIGFSYSWNDGYKYHNPNIAGEMQSKTPDFNNLSVSWSYLPKPNLIIHVECSNVLGSKNIFGYQYANNRNENGQYDSMPIEQVADRFLFLGIFWTLSKDKNANLLNNL